MAAPVKIAAVTSASIWPSRSAVAISVPSIPAHIPAHDQPHHLVGAFQDLVHAQVAQYALDRVIAQIAVAAVELQAAIDHIEAGIGREPLRHGGEPRGAGL